jgi:putative oxidoreductase
VTQALALLIARALLASLFLIFGVRSVQAFEVSAAYFAKLGFPVPGAVTAASIAIQLGAGLLLVLGWKTRLAAWLLVVYVLIATVTAHRYWEIDPAHQLVQLGNFYKNLAIIGGLVLLALGGPGKLSIDRR